MLFIFVLHILFAQNLSDLPGLIPLDPIRPAASDLVYQDKILAPDEARALVTARKITDLSVLEPDATSIVWRKNSVDLQTVSQFNPATMEKVWQKNSYDLPQNPEGNVVINWNEPFEFLENTPETVGRFGFAISQKDKSGMLRTYRVRLDTKNHNVLLRRNLLRKLGYNIPATLYAPKLEIQFKGDFSRDQFINDISKNTFLESERWVLEKLPSKVIIQDAIVFPGAEDIFYNLARGDLTASVIQNRRLFNSLLVPFNLTDVGESINVFSWNPGKVFNKQLSLPFEESYIFTTSVEDARWITRKICHLQRADFEDIVKNAFYPVEVEMLLVEKLISRRNFLGKYLNLKSDCAEINVNTSVSHGDRLKEGKLALTVWPGYASKFSYGDPDAPLSGDELFSFFKSKVNSNILSNLVNEFNTRFVPRTDLGYKIFDHQLDLVVDQWVEFIRTGKVKKTPFAFWTTTYFNTNVIASREIITGSYLGTDNLVQLADVIGFSMDGGFYIGTDGVTPPFALSGSLQGFVTRTYAHIKPIHSIKAALKEPFRNILVPKLKYDLAQKLDLVLQPEFQHLNEVEKQQRLSSALSDFKENLKVGESLIITNSLGGALALSPAVGLSENVSVYSNWSDSQMILSRLHIFRKDEDTIQIFKDPAHLNTASISVGLKARIPILTYTYTRKQGAAETSFFTLNINSDFNKNPTVVDSVRSLSRLLTYSKTDALQQQQRPYVIHHKFKEISSQWNILFHRYLTLKSDDMISVVHPNGFRKNFLRRTTGRRSGNNYEALAIDTINALVKEYTDFNVVVSTNNSNDPADSIKGNSVSELFAFEAEVRTENQRQVLVDPFISLTYKWRNWTLSKPQLMAIIFDINNRFNTEFFHENDFQQTNSIKLSTIEITSNIYKEGIEFLTGFTKNEVKQLLRTKGVFPNYLPTPMDQPGSQVRRLREEREERRNVMYVNIFGSIYENFQTAYTEGNVDNTIKYLSQFVSFAERLLPPKDFYALFGGEQNIFVRSYVSGFRDGDERDEASLTSNSYGSIGSQKGNGPLREIQNQLGISGSEFLIYWLLNKI